MVVSEGVGETARTTPALNRRHRVVKDVRVESELGEEEQQQLVGEVGLRARPACLPASQPATKSGVVSVSLGESYLPERLRTVL